MYDCPVLWLGYYFDYPLAFVQTAACVINQRVIPIGRTSPQNLLFDYEHVYSHPYDAYLREGPIVANAISIRPSPSFIRTAKIHRFKPYSLTPVDE